jgi:hypothetical protein
VTSRVGERTGGGVVGSVRGEMNFVMQRVEYDHHTGRAYVEFREPDGDGGDSITISIFSAIFRLS